MIAWIEPFRDYCLAQTGKVRQHDYQRDSPVYYLVHSCSRLTTLELSALLPICTAPQPARSTTGLNPTRTCNNAKYSVTTPVCWLPVPDKLSKARQHAEAALPGRPSKGRGWRLDCGHLKCTRWWRRRRVHIHVHCRWRAIGDLSLGSRYVIFSSAFERLARHLQRSDRVNQHAYAALVEHS